MNPLKRVFVPNILVPLPFKRILVILGTVQWGNVRVILGLYWDNGK